MEQTITYQNYDDAADVLARTLYGEARGETRQGREAVACVIINRARRGGWWGSTIEDVCRKKWQFSCWNAHDPNRRKIEVVDTNDACFAECLEIARRAIDGRLPDRTAGACHYHTSGVQPDWSMGKTPSAVIGAHHFFNDIE